MSSTYVTPTGTRELKKGSAELLILSLVEGRARHGYDIGSSLSRGRRAPCSFNVASLYPLLYRLEKRGWIDGRWVEKAGQRRRRMYTADAEGRKCWPRSGRAGSVFVQAINRSRGPSDETRASSAKRATRTEPRNPSVIERRRGARESVWGGPRGRSPPGDEMDLWRDELRTRLEALRLRPEREAEIVEELVENTSTTGSARRIDGGAIARGRAAAGPRRARRPW